MSMHYFFLKGKINHFFGDTKFHRLWYLAFNYCVYYVKICWIKGKFCPAESQAGRQDGRYTVLT